MKKSRKQKNVENRNVEKFPGILFASFLIS
jgi:hypothetical protein